MTSMVQAQLGELRAYLQAFPGRLQEVETAGTAIISAPARAVPPADG